MKPLREYIGIQEGLLDIDTNLKKDDIISAIESWLDEHKIYDYVINDDYTIDTKRLDLMRYPYSELPSYIQFNKVDSAWITYSSLVTLRGVPRIVKYDFVCAYNNDLKSLEHSPEKVGKTFYCIECDELVDLTGMTQDVKDIQCHCNIRSLNGMSKTARKLDCSYCSNLKDLTGASQSLREIKCNNCIDLLTLRGCPSKIKKFECEGCTKLTSLRGLPTHLEHINYNNCPKLNLKDFRPTMK